MSQRLPSYPLFVNDPYFSFWSATDVVNESDTVFWHGEKKPIYGILETDSNKYAFLGCPKGCEKLKQTDLKVRAFSTIYVFEHSDFKLEAEFLSPLLPTDLEIASCPVCYLIITLTPNKKLHKVNVKLLAEERVAYDTCGDEDMVKEIRSGVLNVKGRQISYMGLRNQKPLSHAADEVGADWGYYYLVGDVAWKEEYAGRKYIGAERQWKNVDKKMRSSLLMAYDDTVSIFYYGEWLKGYFFRNGKTIFDAIEFAENKQEEIENACKEFDDRLVREGIKYGKDYLNLAYASVRQIMGASKIVETKDKRVLFLTKECNSDGCIATVDVSYPMLPFCKKYNVTLLKGMLYPIMDFAKMPIWKEKFAPHDAGVYPYCIGQHYAVQCGGDSEYCYKDWSKPETLPFYYLFPKDNNIYEYYKQMPVEECANMLIMVAFTEDKNMIKENIELLQKWADYLVEKGLIPENQLCTDDFAGHIDKNANLAIKAIMGIKAFAVIAKIAENEQTSLQYGKTARDYAEKWMQLYMRNDHSVLSQGDEDTYSLKYNLVIDKLLGERVFPEEMNEKETDYYLTKSKKYGIPLDSRVKYTKSDWLMWSAALTEDIEKRKRFVDMLARFLRETEDRVPFSDWYDTETGRYITFRNRTVQGGIFMLLLT